MAILLRFVRAQIRLKIIEYLSGIIVLGVNLIIIGIILQRKKKKSSSFVTMLSAFVIVIVAFFRREKSRVHKMIILSALIFSIPVP